MILLRRLRSRLWWRYREWQADRDFAAGRYETYQTSDEAMDALRKVLFGEGQP